MGLARQHDSIAGLQSAGDFGLGAVTDAQRHGHAADVVAINPNADTVEGDPCFHSLREVPDGVEAVVIGTRPDAAEATVEECVDLGIDQVWMHRSVGGGSVCDEATVVGRENGLTVIDGGCPLMVRQVVAVPR